MTGLTTHVLDLTSGKPADELNISFYIKKSDRKALLADFVTKPGVNEPVSWASNNG